jgi:hypothetical protein
VPFRRNREVNKLHVLTYAVIDKVTAFMSNAWGANGTAKFVNFVTAPFMVTRRKQSVNG